MGGAGAATLDPRWGTWSADMLARVADEAIRVIDPLICAEVSIGFVSIDRRTAPRS